MGTERGRTVTSRSVAKSGPSRAFLAGCGAALGRPSLRDRKGGRERRRRRTYVAQVAREMLGPVEVPRVDVRAGRDERGDLAAPAVHGDAAQPRRGHVTRCPLEYPRVGVTTPLSTPSYTRRIATAAAGNFQETPENFRSADLCTFPCAAPHAATSACRLGWRAGVSAGVGGRLSGAPRGRKFPQRSEVSGTGRSDAPTQSVHRQSRTFRRRTLGVL
jgi:hypothetical protein